MKSIEDWINRSDVRGLFVLFGASFTFVLSLYFLSEYLK